MDAKTAVDTVFVGKERAYNRRFLQMCSHYLVDPPSIGLEPMAPRWATASLATFGRGGTVYNPWHEQPLAGGAHLVLDLAARHCS